ncbi:hypothetical protein LRAMOSA01657 [Lichtheimia ramosa]|uniref:TH1 protein n=1 Tax=Lichtheimia ramosa TaxID=688394 RepID=A0A077WKL3_9FUNG|nr:hypothetical protein LRAMOSA01657 [Lichtheimia ramosa]
MDALKHVNLHQSIKDAILQPGIYSTAVAPFIDCGGTQSDATRLLSESYVGIPSMVKAAADSAELIGVNCQTILRDTIKQILLENFDPERVDATLVTAEGPAPMPWLDTLVEDAHWRRTIYDLLDKYPRCEFLNVAVMRMAESGYKDEVARLRTSSNYVKVYSLILGDTISEIIKKDDINVDESISDLVRVCCEQEHFYLYAQVLLRRLYEDFDSPSFARLSKELEKAATARGYGELVDILRTCANDIPPLLASALKSIRSSSQPSPADLFTVYDEYKSKNPPNVIHIREYELIIQLLKLLFVPNPAVHLRPELVDKMIYIVSYATVFNPTRPPEDQTMAIQDACNTLQSLQKELRSNQTGGDFTQSMGTILESLSLPVASMAVLLWIEYLSTKTPYYETYYRSADIPLPHHLLDEIAYQHPLQRPQVLQVIEHCLSHSYENFAPEILQTLQKRWIERLVYLVQLQYTIPVFKLVKRTLSDADYSLTVHFITLVLESADPPYSIEFIENTVDILYPIADTVSIVKGFDSVLQKLADYTLSDTANASNELKDRVSFIMHKCRSRKRPM